ncbi:MAG: hypothetical protein AB1449_07820 [Chloroflexota bacterium]
MRTFKHRTDVPVLLLHNLDPTWEPKDIEEVQAEAGALEAALSEVGHPVTNVAVSHADLPAVLSPFDPDEYVVFNCCEALPDIPRSDVIVAHTLSKMNFTYTGSTPEVIALSWDKERVKRLLNHFGLPTPEWRIYTTSDVTDWKCFPAIVKPALEHSSYGVTSEAVVLNPRELRQRVEYVLDEYGEPALVEDFIDGREFLVSLWGDGIVQMLPPAEMDYGAFSDVHQRLYTYEAKFDIESDAFNNIEMLMPASLSDPEYRLLEKTAQAVYRACLCRDYARIDCRLRDGRFYVLDVNPNPMIAEETSMTSAAEACGFSYGDMASYLVNFAALRHPRFRPLLL